MPLSTYLNAHYDDFEQEGHPAQGFTGEFQ